MEDTDVLEAPATESTESTALETGADTGAAETLAPENAEAEGTESKDSSASEKGDEDIYAGPDGQKIPPKFAGLFKQHPELRSMFFENREVRQHGGVKALLEASRTLEEIGGRDAVASLQNEVGAWEKLDEAFSSGDPDFASHLFHVDPKTGEGTDTADAASKQMPALIERWVAYDPDGYSHVLGRAMLNTMQGMGVYESLGQLNRLALEDPKVKQALDPLIGFWNSVFDVAQKLPEKRVDPDRQRLEAERTQFEQEREKNFNDGVIGDAKGFLEASMEQQVGKFFKQGGIDLAALRTKEPEMWQMVVEHCDKQIAQAINKDQVFQRNKVALQRARDSAGLKKLYRAKIERVMPEIAKNAYARFTRFGAPAPKAANAAAAAAPAVARGAAEVRIAKRPSDLNLKIDYSRVPPGFSDVQSAVYAGRAYVKGRQGVHVWR